MSNYRGRAIAPSRDKRDFWDEFPGLLLDDKEVPYNDLIEKLRNTAIDYWRNQ